MLNKKGYSNIVKAIVDFELPDEIERKLKAEYDADLLEIFKKHNQMLQNAVGKRALRYDFERQQAKREAERL